eukprot:m.275682 g.275682  ORF g.275682 m.275682 type:complete len:54 (+) comp120874_c0_seq1:816-977(+)
MPGHFPRATAYHFGFFPITKQEQQSERCFEQIKLNQFHVITSTWSILFGVLVD